MNALAESHLSKARDYVTRGEEFYRKAAAEIVAAQEADPMLSQREIGAWFGRSHRWVSEIVTWHTSGTPDATPFGGKTAEQKGRGAVEAKRVLAEAPLEQVEQIISELPRDRQRAVAAAAGHGYMKARQEYEEKESNLTPFQRKEREAAQETMSTSTSHAMAGFNVFGVVNYLRMATDVLKEMISAGTLDKSAMKQVDLALAEFLDEYRVAQGTAGVDLDLDAEEVA